MSNPWWLSLWCPHHKWRIEVPMCQTHRLPQTPCFRRWGKCSNSPKYGLSGSAKGHPRALQPGWVMGSQPRLVMVGLTHPLGQSCGDVHEVSLDTSCYLEVSVLLGTSWHHCCLSEHRACQVLSDCVTMVKLCSSPE